MEPLEILPIWCDSQLHGLIYYHSDYDSEYIDIEFVVLSYQYANSLAHKGYIISSYDTDEDVQLLRIERPDGTLHCYAPIEIDPTLPLPKPPVLMQTLAYDANFSD